MSMPGLYMTPYQTSVCQKQLPKRALKSHVANRRDIDVDVHHPDAGANRLEVASPEDHAPSEVLVLLIGEEGADVEGVLQVWLHSDDDVESLSEAILASSLKDIGMVRDIP